VSGRRRRTVIHAATVALFGWTALILARSFLFVSNAEQGSVGGRSVSDTLGVIVLVGRIVFAIPFLAAGFAHFKMGQQMVAYARSMRAPLPALGGWPAGLWLLVAGLSVLLGVWPDVGALMLAAWGVPTALYIHSWWRYEDEQAKQTQQTIFFRNVTFIGASIVIFGAFVALGDDLRYVITPPLFSF
jgi:putative oxidoreductase